MFEGFAQIGERLGPFDAALIEVGAYDALWADVHLGPEQALRAHQAVRGGLLVPVHWGTFDLALHSWVEPIERTLRRRPRFGRVRRDAQAGSEHRCGLPAAARALVARCALEDGRGGARRLLRGGVAALSTRRERPPAGRDELGLGAQP